MRTDKNELQDKEIGKETKSKEKRQLYGGKNLLGLVKRGVKYQSEKAS